jgi:uncharacterized protein (UPF0335 family)
MTGAGDNSGAELRSIVERVERLEEEIKDLNGDKRDLFAEAKSRGYDVKAIKRVIQLRRVEPTERTEFEAIVETYMAALGMLPSGVAGAGARARVESTTEIPSHDPETGEITEQESREGASSATAERAPEAPAGNRPAETAATEHQSPVGVRQEPSPETPSSGGGSKIRPHCLHPEMCAGYGSKHCHACEKARAESEAA